ncbi:hypothetical protein KI387_044351, partial [Taxus chinensis]
SYFPILAAPARTSNELPTIPANLPPFPPGRPLSLPKCFVARLQARKLML